MSKLSTIIVTVCVSISSVSGMSAKVVAGATQADKAKPQYETRVFMKPCVLKSKLKPGPEGIPAALAAVFVPLLLGKVIGSIGGALKKAGSKESLQDSGRLTTHLYRLPRPATTRSPTSDGKDSGKPILAVNPAFESGACVQIIRGLFLKEADEVPTNPDLILEERLRSLRANGIPIRDIAAVYEAEIERSQDGTALRYKSTFFQVRHFQGDRSQDKRGMVVSLAIYGAGKKEGEPLLSLVMVNLGEVRKNTVWKTEDLENKETSWVGGLGITDASLKAITHLKFPENPTDPKNKAYRHFIEIMPVTVEGSFTQTDDGNAALRFIGEVLESTKEEVAEVLSSELLKDRAEEASKAADAKEQLLQDEEAAYSAYLQAKAALEKADHNKPAEVAAKEFEIVRTRRVWCLKLSTLQKLNIAPARPSECNLN